MSALARQISPTPTLAGTDDDAKAKAVLPGSSPSRPPSPSTDADPAQKAPARDDKAGGDAADTDGLAHNMKPWEIHVAFISLAVGGFLAALDQTIVSTSMPTIASEFNSLDEQSWIATAYLLTSTVFQPFFGRACDFFGCKLMLFIAIGIFEFGSLMTATAQNFIWLCCARAVAGIGGAGLMVVIMVMISQMVPLRERGRYMGAMYARLALANVLGPVLGGVFTSKASWRWCFYINLPIGGIAVAFILLLIHKLPDRKRAHVSLADIDFGGVVLLSLSVVAILLALSWGGTVYPWSSRQVIALLAVGGALVPVFVLYERHVPKEPVIPLGMFRHRNVVTSTVNYFFTNMAVYGLAIYVPTYFQLVKHDSQIVSGLELLPFILPLSAASVLVGFLVVRTGWVRPFLWAGGAVNLLGVGLCILINATTPRGAEYVALLIAGAGMGFVYQTNTLSAQSQVARGELASVTTMTMWSKSLGGIVGIAAQGSILQNVMRSRVLANPVSAPYIAATASVAVLRQTPPEVQAIVGAAYGTAFARMMTATTALTAVGFMVSLCAGRVPLGKRSQRGKGAHGGGSETDGAREPDEKRRVDDIEEAPRSPRSQVNRRSAAVHSLVEEIRLEIRAGGREESVYSRDGDEEGREEGEHGPQDSALVLDDFGKKDEGGGVRDSALVLDEEEESVYSHSQEAVRQGYEQDRVRDGSAEGEGRTHDEELEPARAAREEA